MNSFALSLGSMTLLMGGAQGGAEGAGGLGSLGSFIPLIAIVAIFYFLILRPQRKKQKDTQSMLSSIKKGDRVITIGGIHGVVQSVKDGTIILKVDENVKLEFNRGAIASVTSKAKEEEERKLEVDKDDEKPVTEEKKE